MRDSGWVSTGPNLAKSTTGTGGIPAPAAGGADAGGAAGPRTKASRSSLVMRPFGPVPATAARSTPSSRARRRTPGPAWAPATASPSPAAASPGGTAVGASAAAVAAAVAAARTGSGSVSTTGGGSCWPTRLGGWRSAPSPGWSTAIGVPSLTRSPTVTSTPVTVPDTGAGMSMVALSDSSVTSGSSTLTASPTPTSTSMTGTSE